MTGGATLGHSAPFPTAVIVSWRRVTDRAGGARAGAAEKVVWLVSGRR